MNSKGSIMISGVIISAFTFIAFLYAVGWARETGLRSARYKRPDAEIDFLVRSNVQCANTRAAVIPPCVDPRAVAGMTAGNDQSIAIPFNNFTDRNGNVRYIYRLSCRPTVPVSFAVEISSAVGNPVWHQLRIVCPT